MQYDWLNPLVINQCVEGKKVLELLLAEQGEGLASYTYKGVIIKNESLKKGIRCYKLAIRLALLSALENHEASLPESTDGAGEWTDLLGMIAPKSVVEALVEEIRNEVLTDINDVAAVLSDIHNAYANYKWTWAYKLITDFCSLDSITETDRETLLQSLKESRHEWLAAIKMDAEKEFQMGDVEEDELKGFVKKLPKE